VPQRGRHREKDGIAASIAQENAPASETFDRREVTSLIRGYYGIPDPRFPADIRVDGAATGGPATAGSTAGGPNSVRQDARPGGSTVSDDTLAGATDADLVDLDAMVGRLVRVGGLVVELRLDGFTLDDGTAIGRACCARPPDQLALSNPMTRSMRRPRGATAEGAVVVVDDSRWRSRRSVAAGPSPSAGDRASAGAVVPTGSPGGRPARWLGGGRSARTGRGGLRHAVLISAASVVLTVLRRVHGRRRMTARIAGRLATFAGPSVAPSAGASAGPSGAIPAEREPSTNHSA
jgi:hypothetical protein